LFCWKRRRETPNAISSDNYSFPPGQPDPCLPLVGPRTVVCRTGARVEPNRRADPAWLSPEREGDLEEFLQPHRGHQWLACSWALGDILGKWPEVYPRKLCLPHGHMVPARTNPGNYWKQKDQWQEEI
jgi:hypothetical protein